MSKSSPPERLRLELEWHRSRGHSFRAAWPGAVSRALADEGAASAVWWRVTFGEQRQLWATSYSRARWPANNRPAIAATLVDDDFSKPASRTPIAA